MVGKLTRCLLAAMLGMLASSAAADTAVTGSIHREAVDVSSYPYSAIGKLFNEAGGTCTGVIIAQDKVLTAAHCVYNERTRRFVSASSLHFLVGYRSGRSRVHARVASFETGSGYDPSRWADTMDADWVILTLTESLPDSIAPLKLSHEAAPSGARATIAGYPQDRAHLMTADRQCELGGGDAGGRIMFHTCRGMRGYSGARILVDAGEGIQVAGIHVATSRNGAARKMIAVPAQSIAREHPDLRESDVSWEQVAAWENQTKPRMVLAALADSGWFE